MIRRLSLARTLALASLALGLASCSNDLTPPGIESVAGTYTLVSVDGKPMPSPFYQDPTYGIESSYVDGTMTLHADGTWTRQYTIHYNRDHRDPTPYDVHYAASGTYTWTGGALSLTGTEKSGHGSPVPLPADATVDGASITAWLMTGPNARFVRD